MKYYQLAILLLLLLVLFFGNFLVSPQRIADQIGLVSLSANEFPSASIYSTYPFSNQAEFLINLGSRDGVKESMAVTVDGKFLLGQVAQVYTNTSRVRTIFDPDWQLAVRVGPQGLDALLEGGATPRLTMVAKNKEFSAEQTVYAASRDFRYGLVIGSVKNIIENTTAVFREAEVAVPYNFYDLREVVLLSN